MKKLLKAVLAVALSVVLVVPAMASMAQTEDSTKKSIDVLVEAAGGNKASVTVYDDYVIDIKTSKTGLDLSSVKVTGTLTDIEGLGIEGSKTFEKTGSFGFTLGQTELSAVFPALNGVKVNLDVCDVQGAQYVMRRANGTDSLFGDYYGLKLRPNDKALMADAWTELLSHGSKAAGTGKSFTFVKGSYFIIGGEKVMLDKGDLAVSDISNIGALVDAARSAGSISQLSDADQAAMQDKMEFVMKAGSTVSLAGASVVLEDDATLKVALITENEEDNGELVKMVKNGILSDIRNAASKDEAMNIVLGVAVEVLQSMSAVNLDAEFDHTCKHAYESVVTAPTCVKGGYTTYTCSKCGHSYEADETNPTGIHTPGAESAVACTCEGKEGTDYIVVCTVCGEQLSFRHEDKVYANKVEIDVVSGNATGKVTVNEKFVVTATTAKGQIANADQVSVTVSMKDIAGLGIGSEGRTHTMNLALKTGKGDINLDYWFTKVFKNLYSNYTVNANVCDTNSFTYNVKKDTAEAWTLIGTPTDSSAVSAAWQKVLNDGHITPATTGDGDSRVIIKNGASIQINKELLVLDGGDVTIANANNLGVLEEVIRRAATLKTAETSFDGIIVELPAGSQVVMGSSLVTLEDKATITVEGFHLSDGFLAELKSVTNMNDAFEALYTVAVDVLMNEDDTINVDVDFAHGNEGGNEPGGNEPGGNEPGGNEPGGNEPGGNEPGGNEPGGNEPGGNEPGGNEPGGNEGGNQGGNEGGNQGGNEGGNQGGNQGGNEGGNQGGNNQGGNNQGGNNQGGTGNKPSAPVTADNSAIAFYVVLAAVAAVVAVVSRKRFAR